MSSSSSSSSPPPSNLRIACLLPSATAICIALGLEDSIVGVTHECQILNSKLSKQVCILTASGLPENASQGEIHNAISSASTLASTSCSINDASTKNIPSFYPLLQDQFDKACPNVILTQDLCAVCAPTPKDVAKLFQEQQQEASDYTIVSLQPNTLEQVADTFVTVATACGVPQRGKEFRQQWWSDLERLESTIMKHTAENSKRPRVLLLEWLDPPFDGGHWTGRMMEFAGAELARSSEREQGNDDFKSKAREWNDVYEAKPDVVVVGCCGFDLKRNIQDTKTHAQRLKPLLPAPVFACDGDSYIANPGPDLLHGVAILAQCIYHDQPNVLEAISKLNIMPMSFGFERVDIQSFLASSNAQTKEEPTTKEDTTLASSLGIGDIEDEAAANDNGENFAKLHQEACQQGKDHYKDPETGYFVFTEVGHKKRGFCCGSGCRHCPFDHQNVSDQKMAQKIQQPAILYQHSDEVDGENLFSLTQNDKIKVLFDSGGKDSFLTIRALARQHREKGPFGLVLLTTFDATSRNIAHQDIPIDDVIRQARHLNITLLGVPLRRASGERYKSRIERGLDAVQQYLSKLPPSSDNTTRHIATLVFGDLHLEHIRSWRDQTFQNSGYELEYPLWKAEYSRLLEDLERSRVPCFISGTTVGDQAKVGSLFDRSFYEKALASGLDGFGERGEFHSIAKVWEVDRTVALG